MLGRATGKQRARKRNDFYPTIDPRAVAALFPHVPAGTRYAEPCAGDGDLIELLAAGGLVCDWALELDPQLRRWPIGKGNALNLGAQDLGAAQMFITNPPWTRQLLHALIAHLAGIAPTWCLFDASWKHTRQAAQLGSICTDVVSVGRLKWFRDSPHDPPDDCAWYRFDAKAPAPTRFHWRAEPGPKGGQLALI